jgi:putative ABC transport system permease protein
MINNLRAFWVRLRGLFGDRSAERELDDEIETHLRLLTERYIRQGMSQAEAASAARRKFGNLRSLKEVNREMRRFRVIDIFFQDLRYGIRMLKRNPSFTIAAVATLALGIGANTVIFSVVNAVWLRPLPYREPDRLVLPSHYRAVEERNEVTGADFLDWRDQTKSFEQIAAYYFNTADLTGSGEPERLFAGFVSAGLFATLGVAPALGRAFTRAEDTSGGQTAVILSDGLWRRRFGGDPQVIGRSITVGGQSRTIVGIMPGGFHFTEDSDLWLPLALNATKELGRQGNILLDVIARLKPDATRETASADLSVILERQRQAFPKQYSGVQQIRVISLSESLVGDVRLALLVMFGAVTFVLLIACANVTNLLLARSAARRKEMAIRASIGAGRLCLVRQMLTESMLLSLLGGAAGLLAANLGVKFLIAMSPDWIHRIKESGTTALIDGRVFVFTCAVVVLVTLIAGIYPALHASKVDVSDALKAQSGTRSGQGSTPRALSALMIAELALALVLLVGSGLMIKSFLRLMAVPKGFNPDGVLTLALSPNSLKYPAESHQRGAYLQESLERVRHLPGVQSASLASALPLAPTLRITGVQIEGRPRIEPGTTPIANLNSISPDYFQTMGIKTLAGRPFDSQDGPEAPLVVIINETLARRFFPNENPIDHRLLIGRSSKTIVGVADDVCNRGLDHDVLPEIFLPHMQFSTRISTYLVVRTAQDQNNPAGRSALAAAIRNQVRATDPSEPVNQVVTMDERLSNSVAWRRSQMLLLGVFATVAFIIATVGIYGVISYAVSQRTHEIGIRMALGAQASDVLRMVIWRGMSLALVGVALGLAAALALTRVMKNLLFEVSATDPATFALIALLLVCVALIASYIPARRATRVDPLQSLRHE